MQPNVLRLSDTNSASDSGGRTWGLEGNLIWWLIGGVGGGIVVFFMLVVALDTALLPSIGLALVPVGLALSYIFLLRHGKPPGYDRDFVETLTQGRGFAPQPLPPSRHPFHG